MAVPHAGARDCAGQHRMKPGPHHVASCWRAGARACRDAGNAPAEIGDRRTGRPWRLCGAPPGPGRSGQQARWRDGRVSTDAARGRGDGDGESRGSWRRVRQGHPPAGPEPLQAAGGAATRRSGADPARWPLPAASACGWQAGMARAAWCTSQTGCPRHPAAAMAQARRASPAVASCRNGYGRNCLFSAARTRSSPFCIGPRPQSTYTSAPDVVAALIWVKPRLQSPPMSHLATLAGTTRGLIADPV